jgi:hypothetical protein
MSARGEDCDLVDDFDAALALGRKVIEMTERVLPIDKTAPGVVAASGFELDGVAFDLTVKVRR